MSFGAPFLLLLRLSNTPDQRWGVSAILQVVPKLLTPKPRPIRCIWLLGDAVRIPRMPKDSSRPVASGSRAMFQTTATVPRLAHATGPTHCRTQAILAVPARDLREQSPVSNDCHRTQARCSNTTYASREPGPAGTVCCPGAPPKPLDRACTSLLDVPHPAIRKSLAFPRSPNTPDQRRGVSAILPALPKLLLPKPRPVRCIWLFGRTAIVV